jgi:hypothetical protein
MDDYGMINKADYHQVFEETLMSIIEGLVKHAKKAEISDLRRMVCRWIDFYSKEQPHE